MSDQAMKDGPVWDITKSGPLAFLRFWPELVDHAVLVEQASSIDGLGVAPELFTVAAFTAFFGQAPQPRPAMAPAAGNAVQLCNWKILNDKTNKLDAGNVYIRNVLLNQVPEHFIAPMRINRSIRTRTTQYICTQLHIELGTLTASDIAYLEAKLKEPYQSGAPVPCFLAEWSANLNDLARAGQPMAEFAATTLLQGCFVGIREFNKCWLQLLNTYPQVADRTVARYCAAITIFARDALPLLTAHSAIGMSAVTDQSAKLELMQQKIDLLELALAVQQAPGGKRKRGQPAAAHAEPPGQVNIHLIPFANRLFCWTHGPCQHLGKLCKGPPLDARQQAATWRHQAGSKWKELFKSKEWSVESP